MGGRILPFVSHRVQKSLDEVRVLFLFFVGAFEDCIDPSYECFDMGWDCSSLVPFFP